MWKELLLLYHEGLPKSGIYVPNEVGGGSHLEKNVDDRSFFFNLY